MFPGRAQIPDSQENSKPWNLTNKLGFFFGECLFPLHFQAQGAQLSARLRFSVLGLLQLRLSSRPGGRFDGLHACSSRK